MKENEGNTWLEVERARNVCILLNKEEINYFFNGILVCIFISKWSQYTLSME